MEKEKGVVTTDTKIILELNAWRLLSPNPKSCSQPLQPAMVYASLWEEGRKEKRQAGKQEKREKEKGKDMKRMSSPGS